MANVEQIAEELNKLTLLEASQLSKLLHEKWGGSAAAGWRGSPISKRVPLEILVGNTV